MITNLLAAQVRARAALADRRRRVTAAIPPYWRVRVADAGRDVAATLHAVVEVVHDEIVCRAGEAAHNAWVRAGRDWERSIGLPYGHPDALFLADVAPHLTDEACTCPPDEDETPDWGDVSDVTA